MLYNDYRPKRFGDILGQPQAVEVLRKQTALRAWGHAYLVYGPSGTGKTSCARVLAMALSCQNLDGTGEPCGGCQPCALIPKGAYWDCIEIDGARLGRVDDVRELAYRAHFVPLGGRKVYIIDECHRLSDSAWDALLKLLEEPPPHLAIILVSTRPETIPETVKSRCMLVPFRRLGKDVIAKRIREVAQDWGLALEEPLVAHIAEMADGNLRTALTILEQTIALKA
jgi:DNA polymerase-3 subunit gamma/tau